MNLVLLVVGLLAAAAGCVTIGFGIPINAFSLGNTLIIAGTIALAAGLILIGLAAAIGQLRRIAEALNSGSQPRSGRQVDSIDSLLPPTARMTPTAASPMPARMPAQPNPPDPFAEDEPQPEPHYAPPEPRFSAPEPRFPIPEPRPAAPMPAPMPRPSAQPEPAGPLDWLRAKPKSSAAMPPMPARATEQFMPEVPDEAPLSPQRPTMPSFPEPEAEPKVWPPSRGSDPAEPRPVIQPMPRATPQVEQQKVSAGFDNAWGDSAGATAPSAEPAKRDANVEMPPMPAAPRSERRPEAPPKPVSERSPAILKSGVIDGMPYTLYADGSIEAELPQGTVKFASVDALRAHLEKNP